MHFIYLFVIAFVNSIDNIGIGVAYSVGRIKIGLYKNIIISSIAFLVSYIAAVSGNIISNFLSDNVCTILSVIILVVMGSRMIIKSIIEKDDDDFKVKNIKYGEAISIGVVLALDDVGSSVGSGLSGYSPFAISLPYFIISIMIFMLSDYGTRFFGKLKIGKKATIISGIVMILMGLMSLLE
ncbi:manganese efflux pump [Clostridium sp. YIM B02505]|uniref:Manganese efflux pump n=1 Tax=Clostridium yunnanense TaxID=2800325 RepID=A0ABS1EJY8_9CLOT|nr:manganese efflux pump [Clostridium yunnanense]MBK1809674.1 manganese efflux pump [Clostridium yunnanense]